MLYLGIDQHRKQLTVNLRDEEGGRRATSAGEHPLGAGEGVFSSRSAKRPSRWADFMATLEVCGFNHWLLAMLEEYGCQETVLIQPEERSKKKTDRRDANWLSQTLWVNRRRLLEGKSVQGLRRVQPPSPEDEENRQLTTLRRRIREKLTRAIKRGPSQFC